MTRSSRPGEFELIRRLFAPLAAGAPGAFGLADDAAVLAAPGAGDLVITTDGLVAGVHFRPDDPAGDVARKLLRVNLSDLAAMGARGRAYTLVAMLPDSVDAAWLEAFVAGLAADQETFGVTLVGGDTVRTPGPLSLVLTALGEAPAGGVMRREGARPGDIVYVSGTIGDGALGLLVLRGDLGPADGLEGAQAEALVARYRVPRPRVDLGPRLAGLATAALDVSDGLVADLGHICERSRVDAVVRVEDVPLSEAAAAVIAARPSMLETVLGGGDDYELLFTAPAEADAAVAALAAALDIPLTAIGEIVSPADGGGRVRVRDREGRDMALGRAGYRHF